ncbi:Dehydrogenase/reductase SDR family member 11 [Armadillidium vulgare]|nr:Dehydrogenase/reductase SDR family member 11 [Armadillidium vulgare]
MEKWNGRVALVSGASSGIGYAICENLVKNGMKVVGAARRIDKLQCDVTNDDDVCALFDKIKETFGGVDVCVNNAGIVGTGLDLLNGTTEEWRQITNVNVISLCLLSKLTVKSLRERELDNGHIINISSILAHQIFPVPQLHFYTGTKFAVRALSEGLRQELQAINSNIKVTTVSPGIVKTEILRNIPKSNPYNEKILEINTCLKPEDIAVTVSQILSAPPYMEVHDTVVLATGKVNLNIDQ